MREARGQDSGVAVETCVFEVVLGTLKTERHSGQRTFFPRAASETRRYRRHLRLGQTSVIVFIVNASRPITEVSRRGAHAIVFFIVWKRSAL